MQHRYKITVEYLGTDFIGWQRQNNGPSIQQSIEDAILKFSACETLVYGSGRTDAGVHAYGQVAHFDLPKQYPPHEVMNAINHFLKPLLIVILDCEEVSSEFHARFSAKSRSYVYRILNRSAPCAIEAGRVWHVRGDLNIQAMNNAAAYLVGTHDLTSFRSVHCQSNSPVKSISEIEVFRLNDEVRMTIKAPSFLHNQVRIIMGNLVAVGLGDVPAEFIQQVLLQKDRTKALATAPSEGLYLNKVEY